MDSADPNPNDTDDDIQAHLVCCFILEAPHAIPFVVPVGTCSAMHTSSATYGLFAVLIDARAASMLYDRGIDDKLPL